MFDKTLAQVKRSEKTENEPTHNGGCAICVMTALSFQKEKELATIVKTKSTVIFKPNGKVVNQITYANIEIHLNITSLSREVNDLCNIAKMLYQETSKMDHDTKTKKINTYCNRGHIHIL